MTWPPGESQLVTVLCQSTQLARCAVKQSCADLLQPCMAHTQGAQHGLRALEFYSGIGGVLS